MPCFKGPVAPHPAEWKDDRIYCTLKLFHSEAEAAYWEVFHSRSKPENPLQIDPSYYRASKNHRIYPLANSQGSSFLPPQLCPQASRSWAFSSASSRIHRLCCRYGDKIISPVWDKRRFADASFGAGCERQFNLLENSIVLIFFWKSRPGMVDWLNHWSLWKWWHSWRCS